MAGHKMILSSYRPLSLLLPDLKQSFCPENVNTHMDEKYVNEEQINIKIYLCSSQ
jgi:hypothetical protein